MIYTVALFCLSNGKYHGTIGRFGDSATADAHARHHIAMMCSAAEDQVIEGNAFVHCPHARSIDCTAFVGPVSPSHHLDDLVAVVVPPVSDPIHLGKASYFFGERTSYAVAHR